MKAFELRKKIIFNFSASGVLLILLAALIFYNFYQKNNAQEKVNQIKVSISEIKTQIADLQSKVSEITKYKDIWKKISDKKKDQDGIKMDGVNAQLASIAEKNNIFNPTIRVALPEVLKDGVFNNETANVLFTIVNLSFEAINDVRALSFITEFINSLPGYVIITNMEIKKNRKYTEQDLVAITTGKGTGAISGKLDFFWYVYKSKDPVKKITDDLSPDKPIEKTDQPKINETEITPAR